MPFPRLNSIIDTPEFGLSSGFEKNSIVNQWIVEANREGRKLNGVNWRPQDLIDEVVNSGLIPQSSFFQELPGAVAESAVDFGIDIAGSFANIAGSIGATSEALTGVGESVEDLAEGFNEIIGFNERAEEISGNTISDIFSGDFDDFAGAIDVIKFGVNNALASFVPILAASSVALPAGIGAGLLLNVSESVKNQLDAGKSDAEAIRIGLLAGTGKAALDLLPIAKILKGFKGNLRQQITNAIGNGILEGGTEFTQELIDGFALIEADTTGEKLRELQRQTTLEGFLKVVVPSFLVGGGASILFKGEQDDTQISTKDRGTQDVVVDESQEATVPGEIGQDPQETVPAETEVTDTASQPSEEQIDEFIEDREQAEQENQPQGEPDADTRTEERPAQDQSQKNEDTNRIDQAQEETVNRNQAKNLKVGNALDVPEIEETFIIAGKDEDGNIILVGDTIGIVRPDAILEGQIRTATIEEIATVVADNEGNIPGDLVDLLNKSDPAIPPSRPQKPEAIPDGEQGKDRGFPKQVISDKNIENSIKEGLSENAKKYIPRGVRITSTEADFIIQEQGDFTASLHVHNLENNMADDVRVLLGQKLIRRSSKRIKGLKKDKKFNSRLIAQENKFAVDLVEKLSLIGTKAGQTVQAFANWSLLSPEGALLYATRTFRRKKQEILGRNRPTIEDTKKAVDDATKEAGKQTGKNSKKNTTVKQAKAKVQRRSNQKPKEKLAQRIASELKQPKSKPSPITDMVNTLFAEAKKLLPPKSKNAPKNPLELITLSTQFPLLFQTTWDRAKPILQKKFKNDPVALSQLSEYFNDFLILKEKFPETQIQKAVRKGIKELDIEVDKIVRTHFSNTLETAATVADKIKNDLIKIGMEESDADALIPVLIRDFNRIASETKTRILKQKLGTREVSKNKQFYEKIIELSNLGALTEIKYNELFADLLDVPVLTPELSSAITDLVEEIQGLPDDSIAQQRKIIELTSTIEKSKGFTLGQKIEVLAYANILSGLRTIFQVNPISAMGNSFLNVAVQTQVTGNKKHFARIMSAWFSALANQGRLEAVNAIMTGDDVINTGSKFDIPSTSELIVWPGGKFNPFNYAKYVRRALIAGDVLVHRANMEAHATLTALQISSQQKNLSSKKRTALVSDLMFNTEKQQQKFEEQAIGEGLKEGSIDFKRRVFQLTDQARADTDLGDSNHFASKGTFNHDTEGYLGVLSDAVATVTKTAPGFKIIFLFNRIVTNVMNANLSYTPLGYLRAFNGRKLRPGVRPFSDSEATLRAKATVGTIGMVALYVAASAYDDDDEPFFQVTAAGPRNKGDRGQLRQTGWRPYSIKIGDKYIPYIFTPLAVPFSFVGYMKDGDRYNKDDEKGVADRMAIAGVASVSVLLDQGFLSGLSDFFQAMGRGDQSADAVARFMARTATGITFPNLVRQIDKYFDPTLYESKDIKTALIRGVPVARRGLKPQLNIFGESIRSNTAGASSFLFSDSIRDDEVINFIVDNQLWLSVSSKNISFGGRTIEPDEYYEFIKIRGPLLKKAIKQNINSLKGLDKKIQRKVIDGINRRTNRAAKAILFSRLNS